MSPRLKWLASAAAGVAAVWWGDRKPLRPGARRRMRTRWLLFWALAAVLAPAGRWLDSLRPMVVGRR